MLQIKNLTYNAWCREFLDDASVSLPPGSKVGLVGRNGIGKSTLFKLILGELAAGGDEISLPKTARICDLVVTPEVRLNGVGTTMIAACEDWAAKKRLDRILIEIPMRNFPAISLALKCGYEQCGFLDQYFPNSDPALFFEKKLGV